MPIMRDFRADMLRLLSSGSWLDASESCLWGFPESFNIGKTDADVLHQAALDDGQFSHNGTEVASIFKSFVGILIESNEYQYLDHDVAMIWNVVKRRSPLELVFSIPSLPIKSYHPGVEITQPGGEFVSVLDANQGLLLQGESEECHLDLISIFHGWNKSTDDCVGVSQRVIRCALIA